MTPKDALELLENRLSKLAINHKIGSRTIANSEIKEVVTAIETHVIPTLETTLNELEALKKPPTVEEVCEELDKWYIEATGDLLIANINDFTYDKKEKIFYKRMLNKPHQMTMCRLDTNDCVQLREPLPPHLIMLIGRFYQSLEVIK